MSLILDAINKASQDSSESLTASVQDHQDNNEFALKNNHAKIFFYTIALLIIVVAVYFLSTRPAADEKIDPKLAESSVVSDQPPHEILSKTESTPESKTLQVAEASIKADEAEVLAASSQDADEISKSQPTELNKDSTQMKLTENQDLAVESNSDKSKDSDITRENINQTSDEVAAIYRQLEEESKINLDTVNPQKKPATKQELDKNTLAAYADLKFAHELPEALKEKIPSIMYTAHYYNDGSSTVTLNRSEISEGQKIDNDLFLVDILKDGIIVRFQSEQFKLSALNSWINM